MGSNPGERLHIDPVSIPDTPGRLGLCACPGGRGAAGAGRRIDLLVDLEAIRSFPAAGVVSLVEERELRALGLDVLPRELARAGLWWKHLPIGDMGIPDREWEQRWTRQGAAIRRALAAGDNVVLHCWAGLGRTGTVAARLLTEFGLAPAAAIGRVRDARPGSIQTRRQERYVLEVAHDASP
jgi:ADP-ribosyl-[dinitrogen reductase] hydrolase